MVLFVFLDAGGLYTAVPCAQYKRTCLLVSVNGDVPFLVCMFIEKFF